MIKIYNTMTRKKETFTPLEKGKVKMYTCGPTVYNYVHIGNGRMAVVFDAVRRFLQHEGYDVTFVQNVTDVDDRIIETAKEKGRPETEISDFFTTAYNEDLRSLYVLQPTVQPKVTEHIQQIIELVSRLIEQGFAYEIEGDVYYRVTHFEHYGGLSGQKMDHMQGEHQDHKEHDHDFALWKTQKEDEIAWQSPWGLGRPGWHIECSAMAMEYLGETLDIHGGGLDLCFPHHENEIAQSEAATGKTFARNWMHNNYVTVEGVKMSKSLGNFTTIRDALTKYTGEEIRWFYLSNHYRSPMDYSESSLNQAKSNIQTVKNAISNLEFKANKDNREGVLITSWLNDFEKAMRDDFNTSEAITVLLSIAAEINRGVENPRDYLKTIRKMVDVLGFEFHFVNVSLTPQQKMLIERRDELKKEAKEKKDGSLFSQADQIRKELIEQGIILEDTPEGTKITKKNP